MVLPEINFHITFTRMTSYDVNPNEWTVWLYKMFYRLQIVKTKVKVKSWVKPQSGSVKVWLKILLNHHVGDQILKFLSPTEKITRICEWVSGYLQPCSLLMVILSF